jgi:asparagine synthase (glutamine-hydrolysing)
VFHQRKRALYKPDFAQALGTTISSAPSRHFFDQVSHESLLHQMLYVDSKTWLPDDLLVKADKMTMATSVELRVPLLDHQVLEFAASLPEEYKVRGNERKRVLKAALKDSVPRELLDRKKAGFPVPFERWLRHDLREYVRETIDANDAAIHDYFSREQVRAIVDEHARTGKGSKEVFGLLVLELWHRAFVTEPMLESQGS